MSERRKELEEQHRKIIDALGVLCDIAKEEGAVLNMDKYWYLYPEETPMGTKNDR